jgi:putative ABC transport system permease protein
MFKNYLISAIRNIIKSKLFSIINIAGLAIGMTAFLLIFYYVIYEKSYDKFFPNSERIYRARYERTDADGQAVKFASSCPPIALRIRQNIPEVEKVGRLFRFIASVSAGEKKFNEENMFFAETDFLYIFQLKYLSGNSQSINEPNKAIISNSTAKKYFGEENPLGKIISTDKKVDYQIAGVFEDIPENSHIQLDILLSYQNLITMVGKETDENSWGDSGWFTYLLFKKNADIPAFEKKLADLVEKEVGEMFRQFNLKMVIPIQSLQSIHLNSNYMQEFKVNGDKSVVDFLSIIALFIIVIAWFNYINLSTAQSLTRAREIGLRKVVGASRQQIMIQFLVETSLVNIFAVFLTLILIVILMPLFRILTDISTDFSIWSQSWFWLYIAGLLVFGIICAGGYPIFVMSGFNPVKVIKGKLSYHTRGFNLRKVFVVFQFVIAITLITCTIAVISQLSYMKNQDIGFDKEQILVVKAPRVRNKDFASKISTMKEQLLNNSIVNKFCLVTEVPGKQILWDAGAIHRVGSDVEKNYQIVGMDNNYTDLFNLKFVAGRNFYNEISDTSSLILNETAVQWLGFKNPEDAVGKQVSYWEQIFNVVGVLKDFHQQSLKKEFEPHIYRYMPTGRGARAVFAMKITNKDITSTIKAIQNKYEEFFPGNPFEYFFIDEYFNRQYKSDEQFGRIFSIFSFLAIFVTCLGVLGLSSFISIQRTKETGIRKILGASVLQIVNLFLKDFLTLVLIAFIVSVPISYYLINRWLAEFAVKMPMNPLLFILPLILVLIITIITVCAYTIKASTRNPIDNIRYE